MNMSNETRLRIPSFACAVFTFIAPKCLDICTEAVEYRVLINFGRGRDRGESGDQVSEVYDLGCDTTAMLGLFCIVYNFLRVVALKQWVRAIAQQRALR